ncbi:MAG: phage portal protein [Vicinamibacterales bacterium]
MGFLTRIAAEQARPSPWSNWWFGDAGLPTRSGMRVSASKAMRLSALWAAYRVIVEGVASMPCQVYRRLERGKVRAAQHPLYDLLRWQPNAWQTALEYWEMKVGHVLLRGNAYSLIVPGRRGAVDQLIPLHPDRMEVERLRSGRLRYIYSPPDGGDPKPFVQDEIFHVRGMGSDGVKGLSLVEYARESFGVELAKDAYEASLYGSAPRMAGIIEVAGKLDEDGQTNIATSFREAHSGPGKWHSVAVLQRGMKWTSIGMNAKDAQFMEAAEFGIAEISRWTGVPMHRLAAMKDPSHTNIEQYDLELVMHTFRPYVIRFEQAIQRDLMVNRDTYFTEFLMEALLRGDSKARADFYKMGIDAGWLTRNEAREKENLNPLPGLDEPLQPLNMGTPGQLRQARAIVHAAADRVVRKEVASLRSLAEKCAHKPAEWEAAVTAFYGKHERFVQQALQLTDASSRGYVIGQKAHLMSEGLQVLEAWPETAAPMLAGMALEPAEMAA